MADPVADADADAVVVAVAVAVAAAGAVAVDGGRSTHYLNTLKSVALT